MSSRNRTGGDHQDWLAAVAISGPFLALPVLTRVWPTLESIDRTWWPMLRVARADGEVDADLWIDFLLRRLCGWGELLRRERLGLSLAVPEHATSIEPDFALVGPDLGNPRLLGMMLKPGNHPTVRTAGDPWPATPVDRLARLCRHHRVPLGLVTDGRWFALVAAPPHSVTSTAVFDTATWAEAADRNVVRAFVSLLERRRFFSVPAQDTLPALLRESLARQAEVTGVLGDQVRRAVEMLVSAIGWHDLRQQQHHRSELAGVGAGEVYHAAVTMVMRVVFLLYAEERGLLPVDNDLYALSYSVSGLGDELERLSQETSEEDLEQSCGAWLRMLAVCESIHTGIDHPRLKMPTYDGPMFDPSRHPWLSDIWIDDRTVLHVLAAVRYVQLGAERRRLSFRSLQVEQIGHVYERLLAFQACFATDTIVELEWSPKRPTTNVRLTELERLLAQATSPSQRADALIEAYGAKTVGGRSALLRRLAPPEGAARISAIRLLYAATGGDRSLTDRLLPVIGLLARDLRDLPVVVPSGALYVSASEKRANTGTHYTPPELADEVSTGALEDLVHYRGPAQTSDPNAWRVRHSNELLSLRVLDAAVGSGAFLVSACRYLAEKLIEAWANEGNPNARDLIESIRRDGPADDVEADALVIHARRMVIQHCLYGVDIDPMAIEIAKLSLWLISLDKTKPFTFLDHRLVVGDSLLGITTVAQLEELHFDPAAGRQLRDRRIGDPGRGVRELVRATAADRRALTARADNSLADVQQKGELWRIIQQRTAQQRLIADLLTGAMLVNAGQPGRQLHDDLLAVADLARRITEDAKGAAAQGRALADQWLAVDLPPDEPPRVPLHWPLVFADVFEQGGFDAVVGNQPYLGGQKISGALGARYRELLIAWIGGGARGSADLVAYFVLRSHELLNDDGVAGLIATNTLAQGDTREVGLAQLVAAGITIRRATKSRRWPTTSATLEVCLVKTAKRPPGPAAIQELDGTPVRAITPSLDPASRIQGSPFRLRTNAGTAFQGSNILGLGFTLEPERAQELIEQDPRNAEVLFPYLNGQDLNSRPDCSASRWVINFHDWPKERAATYVHCFEQVATLVKPERARNNDRRRREIWWLFTRPALELHRSIGALDRVVAITLVSKVVMPVMVPTGQVFAHKLGVFATDDPATLAMLSSSPHYWWAISRSSTLESRTNYSPSDVFETFARPELTSELRALGELLDTYRRDLMLARQTGLTATYNLVHNPACTDDAIGELRRIHVAIDEAVLAAYGWTDLDPDHGFHETQQGTRYTVGPVVRQEILDRLLDLNHARHAAEERDAAARTPRQLTLPADGAPTR